MIASLLPPGLLGAELRDSGPALALHPQEEIHVARAAQKRRRDFAAGRACARAALAPLGWGDAVIGMDKDGAPLWPPGIAGSITHTSGYAAAVVSQTFTGIGVDAERVGGVTQALWRRLFSEAEQAVLAADDGVAATVMFSAKESAFKAWRLSRALGFRDIAIALDEGGFTAAYAGKTLRGRHAVEDDLVLTLAWF